MGNKFILYAAFGEDMAQMAEEKSKMALKHFERLEFDTPKEREAFIRGVQYALGADDWVGIFGEKATIEKKSIVFT